MVDGDNHVYETLDSMVRNNNQRSCIVYYSDKNLEVKLHQRYDNVLKLFTIYVKPGDQAVDKRIKTDVGQILKEKAKAKVVIYSHDKGYDEYIKRVEKKGKKNRVKRKVASSPKR